MKLRLKEPFGKAGLTVAICALVLAMLGGAYAAGGLTKSQEKQVTKIAKKYAGKPGAEGKQGPPGSAGTNGTNGKDGTNGTNGTPGKSVTVTAAGEAECEGHGGAIVKQEGAASATEVCNGETGFTETLPFGKTERGVWASGVGPLPKSFAPISYNIPLETAPTETYYLKLGEGETQECPGTAAGPAAAPGNLCIYVGAEHEEVSFFGTSSADPRSGMLLVFGSSGEHAAVYGTWAVTAN